MRRLSLILLITFALLFISTIFVSAQTYSFELQNLDVHVFWNDDGTSSIDYVFVFVNDSFASPIDFVDVGLPNRNFNVNSIFADRDGIQINNISSSDYQGLGDSGVAVGLGANSIQPGETGTVHVFIGVQRNVLYEDDDDPNYVSAVFVPTYFGSQFVHGETEMCVTYHFPASVQPEEPRWHQSPTGFPSEPETGFDEDGRIVYRWCNPEAEGSREYQFGASFPLEYVPKTAVVMPSFWETIGIDPEDFIGVFMCCGFVIFMLGVIGISVWSTKRRKLQYLPPKIAIEGHGIKRGLTAVEAAILLEQPMDKILTMILFSTVKKEAVVVKQKDPLELEVASPLPESLRPYEIKFIEAFNKKSQAQRRKDLQEAMIDLVEGVSNKMKGFSRKETIAYYEDIVKRAWNQVESSGTPEVKSEKFDEVMEWTMLDDDYDRRTRDIFRTGPVFVPMWWPRYDPTFPRTPSAPSTTGGSKGSISLPNLPGSDFAASIVGGVEAMSAGVVGSITDFTGKITQKTNPPPVRTSSSGGFRGGGGGGCACACACAGCACACAGGGR